MPGRIEEAELLDYHYGLVDMHQINCAGLLCTTTRMHWCSRFCVISANASRRRLSTASFAACKELLGTNERQFREYMIVLEIRSENRDLKTQVEEAERMLTEIDIERLPSTLAPHCLLRGGRGRR